MSSTKILMPQLTSMLAAATGKSKKQSEAFLKAYFSVLSKALENHETVKIKDLGTFKISRVEARKSVNVSNGEEVRIPPHYKIVFTPSKSMAEKVNREFAWLDIVELADNVSNDELENVATPAETVPESPVVEEEAEDSGSVPEIAESVPEEESSVEISGEEEIQIPEEVEVGNSEEAVVGNAEEPVDSEAAEDTGEKEESIPEIPLIETVRTVSVPVMEPVEETVSENLAPIAEEITREEEERSEQLGEEMEKEFGDIEPAEPFGPIDPDDPMPGTPEPDNAAVVPQPEAVEETPEPVAVATQPMAVVEEETPEPVAEIPQQAPVAEETPQPEEVAPRSAGVAEITLPSPEELAPDFDPYAMETPGVETQQEEPQEPYYVTRDELDNLATKADLRIIARNLKKVRVNIEKSEETNKKRARNAVIWAVVLSAALVIGGFFLTYFLLLNRFSQPASPTAKETPAPVVEQEPGDDDEYEPATVAGISQAEPAPEPVAVVEKKKPEPVAEAEKKKRENVKEAPTSPSDIKAMDKITNTRYLTTMAKEHYGNYNLWPYIYIENEGKLGHPDRIKPGTSVVIPNIDKYNIDPSNPRDIEKARKLGVEIYRKYASN